MADDKKQNNKSNTKEAQTPVKTGAGDGENGGKASKTRMIYRHHRKFMGGGLVGLILFAFLVGTEIIPLYKQQADDLALQGQAASESQPQTAIKVLERQHGKADTKASNGKSTEKSVVSRNGDAHQAQIKIHEDVFKLQGEPQMVPHQEQAINAEDASLNSLRQQVKNLHKISHEQQQMIRMLTQKQNQQKEELTEKLDNLSAQLSKTVKVDKPLLQKIDKSFTLLRLRQDALFFYNQWQEGELTQDTLRQWEKFVANKGLNKAAQFTSALRESLEKYGLLNRQAVQQTAKEMHTRILAAQKTSTKPKTQNSKFQQQVGQQQVGQQQMAQQQMEQEPINKGWWQKLKDRLSGLVRIKRLENEANSPQADVNGQKHGQKNWKNKKMVLRENVSRALAQGDMKSFWRFVQKNQENDKIQDEVVEQLRMLVNVHMVQKDIFQQLYRPLAVAQKRGE